MNKKYTYTEGFETGYEIANESILDDLNPESYSESDIEKFISDCSSHESDIYRQYSPFEFFAKEINDCYNSESLWESYDNGVHKGILKCVRQFKRDNKKGYKREENSF